MHVAVERSSPHVLYELVISGVRHVDVQGTGDHLTVVVLERHTAEFRGGSGQFTGQINLLREGVQIVVGHREVVTFCRVGGCRIAVVDHLERSHTRRDKRDRFSCAEVAATAVGLHAHRVGGLLVETHQDVRGLRSGIRRGDLGGIIQDGDEIVIGRSHHIGFPIQRGIGTIDIVHRKMGHRRTSRSQINRDIIHIDIGISGAAVHLEGDIRFARGCIS